jgi:hypothetical protein
MPSRPSPISHPFSFIRYICHLLFYTEEQLKPRIKFISTQFIAGYYFKLKNSSIQLDTLSLFYYHSAVLSSNTAEYGRRNKMATISIALSDSVLAAALNEALGKKTSLDVFIEGAITAAISNPTAQLHRTVSLEKLLDDALNTANNKLPGERFLLKDVCNHDSWNDITTGERKIFGKVFRKSVETLLIAELVEKTSSNQAIYKRL